MGECIANIVSSRSCLHHTKVCKWLVTPTHQDHKGEERRYPLNSNGKTVDKLTYFPGEVTQGEPSSRTPFHVFRYIIIALAG